MRSPSSASTAGNTVTEPMAASATTRIAPSAIEVNVPRPVTVRPASPTITVSAATMMARPMPAVAAVSAAWASRPARRSSRSRRM